MPRTLLLAPALLLACFASSPNQASQAVDFSGTWVGKWDNTWCVQFVVTEDPTTKNASVSYEWLERSGQPLRTLSRSGLVEGAKLQIKDPYIEIFLSGSPGQAVAFGHFSPARAAVLVRESTRRCQEDGQIQ